MIIQAKVTGRYDDQLAHARLISVLRGLGGPFVGPPRVSLQHTEGGEEMVRMTVITQMGENLPTIDERDKMVAALGGKLRLPAPVGIPVTVRTKGGGKRLIMA